MSQKLLTGRTETMEQQQANTFSFPTMKELEDSWKNDPLNGVELKSKDFPDGFFYVDPFVFDGKLYYELYQTWEWATNNQDSVEVLESIVVCSKEFIDQNFTIVKDEDEDNDDVQDGSAYMSAVWGGSSSGEREDDKA